MQVQQLPVADTSPESMIQQQYEENKQQIQQRFKLGWDEINRRSSMLGPFKTQTMLAELHTKAKQEAMSLNQSMQGQLNQLAQVDDLGANGLISNADEVKWRMTLGPEAERSMFPQEKAPKTLESQMATLEAQENRLRSDAGEFIMGSGGSVPHWYNFALWPRFEEKQKDKLYKRTYDPAAEGIVQFDKKDYTLATDEDKQYRTQLGSELKDVRRRKHELLNQPDIANRLKRVAMASKRMAGGTLAEGMKVDIQSRAPKPKAPPQPVRFTSPDGTKSYTVPGERVAEFTRQFPGYKRTR